MEIISIYCFIAFILGAVFMLTIHCIVAMGKVKEPMNKVHFYVARDKNGKLYLYMCKPIRKSDKFIQCNCGKFMCSARKFSQYGLNEDDYVNLEWYDDPVEVFINLED